MMTNLIQLSGLLILLTNICIHANIIGDAHSLTNEFELKTIDQEKIKNEQLVDEFSNLITKTGLLRMIRKLRKDDKKIKQKCVIKMTVCILSIPNKSPR
jgi:hypothetical protein